MLGLTPLDLGVVVTAVLVGAVVQSIVGLGLGLVAAPVVTLVEPAVMPELLLWLAVAMPLVTLAGEREDIDWRGLGWAFPPRLVGTVGGVAVVVAAPDRLIGVAVGVMVLVAVVLTWRTVRIPVNRPTLVTAGLVSGVTGTATSIGGPPLAILYQHRPPREIRTTMAVYFLGGATLSLVGLAVVGEVNAHDALLALAMVPVLLVGAWAGQTLRPRMAAERVRPAVLAVCGGSALVLLVRSITG
ncbi:sulfite exporter TauE/SafE family protein [Nocardioides sp. HDW12B]|uniref:sulfite exporter TauE/SafE family protein n=1 Tax=Nocardioides sp. HDW12B TaxID=2714939 RepID=UPI001409F42D|nr:sulfite exporter TauE/SafE family protein [Nocardioides sp. HDW12B]QIK66743.1 sulfite exporter TauE/SafE family protein [Nocardioides sp. HDW12B]